MLIYENGILKITVITALTLLLSYYFDLYEPQRISGPMGDLFSALAGSQRPLFSSRGRRLLYFPDLHWPSCSNSRHFYCLSLCCSLAKVL